MSNEEKKEKMSFNDINSFFKEENEVDVDKFFNDEEDIIQIDEKKKEEEESPKNKEYSFEDEDEDIDEEKKKKESKKGENLDNISLVLSLKEKGIIDFELEEDEDLTEEVAMDILEEGLEKSISNQIQNLFNSYDPVVKQFNKFVYDGGNPYDFIKSYKETNGEVLKLDMSLEKENEQEKVLKELLKEEGLEDDFIETQIQFLKDSDKLESYTKNKYKIWEKKVLKQKEDIIANQEKEKQRRKKVEENYKEEISDLISKKDKLGSLSLNKQDKRELASYITRKNVKMENGQVITSFYADLYEVLGNQESLIQLAKLLKLKDKKGNFDFKEIEKDINSNITKNIKNKINKNENQIPSSKNREKDYSKMSLIDFLEGN